MPKKQTGEGQVQTDTSKEDFDHLIERIARYEREHGREMADEPHPRPPEQQAAINRLLIERKRLLEWLYQNEIFLRVHFADLDEEPSQTPATEKRGRGRPPDTDITTIVQTTFLLTGREQKPVSLALVAREIDRSGQQIRNVVNREFGSTWEGFRDRVAQLYDVTPRRARPL